MMFPGSRSCINLVSRVVRLLTHIDDARAYIVPYIHRRFIPSTLAPTVGLSARGFTIRWVQTLSRRRRVLHPHGGRGAQRQHRPCVQLTKSTGSCVAAARLLHQRKRGARDHRCVYNMLLRSEALPASPSFESAVDSSAKTS